MNSVLSVRARVAIVIMLGIAFGVMGVYHIWPNFYAAETWHAADDWSKYHRFALDVYHNGLAMPNLQAPYTIPAGFLYVYFIALIYAVFGINPVWVFLIQSFLLGISIGLFWMSFRRWLSPKSLMVLLLTYCCLAYLDVYRHYVFRLLSENLVIFEAALFFNLLFVGYLDDKKWARISAIAWLGVLYITRPNMLFFVVIIPVYLQFYWHHKRGTSKELLLSVFLLLAIINLMGLRNYVACGEWTLLPPIPWNLAADGHLPYPLYWIHEPFEFTKDILLRFLYAIGFMKLIIPTFNYRPHWIILHGMFFIVLIYYIFKKKQKLPFEIKVFLLYIVAVLSPVILIAQMASYGFRFLLPTFFPITGLAMGFFEYIWPKWSNARSNSITHKKPWTA